MEGEKMKWGHITWKRDIVLGTGLTTVLAVYGMVMANAYVLPQLMPFGTEIVKYTLGLAVLDVIVPNEYTED
jgi:hypothetical protein